MIDMLGVVSLTETKKALIDDFASHHGCSTQYGLDKHYRLSVSLRRGGSHYLTIKTQPRQINIRPTLLSLNPARLSGKSELLKITSNLLRGQLEINRIDLCSDIEAPIEDLYSRTRVKFKQKVSEFEHGSKLTGYYFGVKNEVLVIYDKAYQLEKSRKIRPKYIKGSTKSTVTRFEVRLKGGKIPHRSLEKIGFYREYNPFSFLEIENFANADTIKPADSLKAKFLREQCEAFGFNHTSKLLGASNNFNKTFGRYLSRSSENDDLLNNYRKNISTFLEN